MQHNETLESLNLAHNAILEGPREIPRIDPDD